jgi:O-succinylbenzoate synthase
MIHLTKIILREVHLPLKTPFRISSGVQTMRRIFLLEFFDADGTTCWGECVAPEKPNYLPETIDGAWMMMRDWIAPLVLNQTLEGPRSVKPLLDEAIRGHNMAKAAVEMPCWVLEAQKQGRSLSDLLGGTRTKAAAGVSIGIHESPQALVETAAGYLAEGYRKIKMKIKPGQDLDYLAAVREALGPTAPLMVDANNAYSLDDLDVLKQFDRFDLVMIEQPLAWDDYVRHATLQKHLQTPICLDESITGLAQAEDMIKLGSGRIINIKPGRVGGFAASIAIHDLCGQHGIPVWCGGMLESGIGRAYNISLASLSNFTIPGDISPSNRYWERDILTHDWTMDKEGMVQIPVDKIGLGVEPDMDRIDDLIVRAETLYG